MGTVAHLPTSHEFEDRYNGTPRFNARVLGVELSMEIKALLEREQERSRAHIRELCGIVALLPRDCAAIRATCSAIQSIEHDIRLREPHIEKARELAGQLERAL